MPKTTIPPALGIRLPSDDRLAIAEWINDIDSVNGCEIGAARDALKAYIDLADDETDTSILRCIHAALRQATDTVERLCSEAKDKLGEEVNDHA